MKNTALTKPESELCLKCDAKVCLSEQCKQPQKIVTSDFVLNIFRLIGFVIFAVIAFSKDFFIDIPFIGESVLLGCLVAGVLGLSIGHLIGKYAFPIVMKQWKENKPCKVQELQQREKEQEAKRNDPILIKRQLNETIAEIKEHQEDLEKEKDFQQYQDQIDILKYKRAFYETQLFIQDIIIFGQSLDFLILEKLSTNKNEIKKLINKVVKKREEGEILLQKLRDNCVVSSTEEGKKYIKELEEIIKTCQELEVTLKTRTTNLLVNKEGVHTLSNYEEKLKELRQAKDKILKHSFAETAQLERNLESISENKQENVREDYFRFTPERPKHPIYRK